MYLALGFRTCVQVAPTKPLIRHHTLLNERDASVRLIDLKT